MLIAILACLNVWWPNIQLTFGVWMIIYVSVIQMRYMKICSLRIPGSWLFISTDFRILVELSFNVNLRRWCLEFWCAVFTSLTSPFIHEIFLKMCMWIFIKSVFKCYTYGDHIANNCTKGPDFRVCLLWASNDHVIRDYENPFRNCINCGGDYSALVFACPIK